LKNLQYLQFVKKSFDALRDSNLFTEQARIQWALDHDSKDYTHWFTECQVRPGSDSGAQARWEKIGRTKITTVTNAKKFLGIVTRHNLQLSQKALDPAEELIQNSLMNEAIILDEIDLVCGQTPTHVNMLLLKPKSHDEMLNDLNKKLENARSGEESDDSAN